MTQTGPGIPAARDVITPSGRGHLNDYWLDNPEHVLGQLTPERNSATFTVGPRSEPLGHSLQIAFDQIATILVNGLHPGVPSRASVLDADPGRPPTPGPDSLEM